MNEKTVIILGTRGLPASHGGFETFAQYLSQYLISKGWKVIVYCQEEGRGETYESVWKGVHLIHIYVRNDGSYSTVIFDLKSIIHSQRFKGVFLTLGYNTAVFNFLYRLKGKPSLINMDGIEWKRGKWGMLAKVWFWVNDWLGCWFGNHLIADHPCIKDHLVTRVPLTKITTIPYGAVQVNNADSFVLTEFRLERGRYAIMIARPEPENSILEIVQGFSNIDYDFKLIVLGQLSPDKNLYHRDVIEAAGDNVVFLGAVYDMVKLQSLRFYARFYVHGHQVGGTNPSLVESIGCGNAILAHDNSFNRWVAKNGAIYFKDEQSLTNAFKRLISDDLLVSRLQVNSRVNYKMHYKWENVLSDYESLLLKWLPGKKIGKLK